MSTKYLKNRNFIKSLKNIAVWGYWTGVGSYGEGTTRANAPLSEALTGMEFILEPITKMCGFISVLQMNPDGHGSYLCILELLLLELSSIKNFMLDVRDHNLTRL